MTVKLTINKQRTAVLAMILTLAGCTSEIIVRDAAPPERLNSVENRITDQAIRQDHEVIDNLRQRLRALNDSGRWPMDNYHVCKAQAWIDFAEVEYTDNDRGTVVESAMNQARALIEAMQTGAAALPVDTPIPEESTIVRPDLWALVKKTKQERKGECFDCTLAKLEVQLVAAGHDQKELGGRHAESGIMASERLARSIREGGQCPSGNAQIGAPMATAIGQREKESAEELRIPVVVHFAYDSALLSDETGTVLTRVAKIMRDHEDITVRLVGHTDPRGSDDYNEALGRRRADAVQVYLATAGVRIGRISKASQGEQEPIRAQAPEIKGMALDRRVELQFAHLPDIKPERQLLDVQPDH